MIELVLVRHGETVWSGLDRCTGTADVPLSPLGERQARRLADRLADWRFDAVHASDRRRALDTVAPVLAGRPELMPRACPRLRERDFGRWEGAPWSSLPTYAGGEQAAPGEVETLESLAERVASWWAAAGAIGEGRLLVVSHGGPLRVLLCLLLGLPPERHWSFRIDLAGLSVVRCVPDMATLMLLNDRSHLTGLDDGQG